jgi:hypothetical protein
MWRATVKGLLARKVRLLLSATSIVFGSPSSSAPWCSQPVWGAPSTT